ncbi:hypothetical protein R3P38DRAFT_3219305 [Favolaschia claudopus]|uniref:F-box domain-containing protein n=1 Tax=Favolaschia claudopus TaxID=2862362 RepID=A0AAW0A438_9AGAR
MSRALAAAELRQHIEELTATITEAERTSRTTRMLDLTFELNEAQRKLNSFVDPIARLPLEIQSHIFLYVLHSEDQLGHVSIPRANSRLPPMGFLSVSCLWRDIALSSPNLWRELELELPSGDSNYFDLCGLFLSRARNLSLSLTLRGSLDLEPGALDLVAQYSHQLENLTLNPEAKRREQTLALERPQPRSLTFRLERGTQLPCLKTLVLQPSAATEFGTVEELLDVFRAAPALSTFTLDNTWFDLLSASVSGPFTHASLHTLSLGSPLYHDEKLATIITPSMVRYLTLPALKNLSVHILDLTYNDVVAFLSRSSPPLESLYMSIPVLWRPIPDFADFLRHIPSLKTLHLCTRRNYRDVDCCVELLRSSDFLPNLRAIELDTDIQVPVDYERVARMLTLRGTASTVRLESFELRFLASSNFGLPLPAHVKSTLQQVVQDGMKIYIGSPRENML